MKILYNTQTQTLQPYPRLDDEDVVGLDPIYLVYTVVQETTPTHDPASQALQSFENIDHVTKEVVRGWDVIDIAHQIFSVSMLSMRLVLVDAGLYQAVLTIINSIPDETEKLKVQVWWDTARTVEREHPLVLTLSAAIGQTTEQVDQLFILAEQKDLTL